MRSLVTSLADLCKRCTSQPGFAIFLRVGDLPLIACYTHSFEGSNLSILTKGALWGFEGLHHKVMPGIAKQWERGRVCANGEGTPRLLTMLLSFCGLQLGQAKEFHNLRILLLLFIAALE